METEIWKDIPEWEGHYEVSTYGNVRSIDKPVGNRMNSKSIRKGKILKPTITPAGYQRVSLSKKNYKFNSFIHRLIAKTFIPNPENKPEVNHINGIKTDNRIENLEWCTGVENVRHGWALGLCKVSDNCRRISSKKVIDTKTKKIYASVTDAAKSINLSITQLVAYLKGRAKNKSNFQYYSDKIFKP